MHKQYRTFSNHNTYRDGDKISFSTIMSDGEFQLTETSSAETLDEVVEEVQKSSNLVP